MKAFNLTDLPASLPPYVPYPSFLRRVRMLLIRSFGFAGECLGQHSGSDQEANLGDGHGYCASTTPFTPPPHSHFDFLKVNETAVMRLDYGDPTLGTCKESVQGGNHFRYWVQSGGSADRYYLCLSSSASLENPHLFFFFSFWKVGLFSWPFHMNFQNNVSHTFSSRLPIPSLTLCLCAKVGHDIIYNGCALSLSPIHS